MTGPRTHRRPAFLWQALLILLPVVVLAILGLISLRQDRRLADEEARERAQQIADDLADKIWKALAESQLSGDVQPRSGSATSERESTAPRFQISSRGELLFPPPVLRLIPQSMDMASLSPAQQQLWQKAQALEFGSAETDQTLDAYRDFIQTKPPATFAAVAEFSLGLQLLKQKSYDAAFRQFAAVSEQYPEIVLESGIPLRLLAQTKMVEITKVDPARRTDSNDALLEIACSNTVLHPTPLTPLLLQQLAEFESPKRVEGGIAGKWLNTWQSQERALRLYAAAETQLSRRSSRISTVTGLLSDPQFSSVRNDLTLTSETAPNFPSLFWFNDNGSWLAIVDPGSSGSDTWFLCLSETQVRAMVNQLIATTRGLPDYFGVSLELGGRSLIAATNLPVWWEGPSGKGGGPARVRSDPVQHPPAFLASSKRTGQGIDQLKIGLYLTSPSALFARQRSRTLWFGLLIVTSTATAMVGLVVAWRAFDRQQRLNEMKTNFVSSVSHELRAPIASVRLMAESLDRGKVIDGQKQADYFRLIVQECRRLTSLIENVLDFSRIDQGRKHYEFEPTDLGVLIEQTVNLMKPYAADWEISLQFNTLAGNVSAEVDGKAIQQALVNLLDNAIKHSSSGATVHCEVESSADSEPAMLNVFVQDQGDGIPPEEHAKIFEPFYRRGSELRRETPGVGIGLSIVKSIVEAHGGKVTVRSAVGEGSRFTMAIPVVHNEMVATKGSAT